MALFLEIISGERAGQKYLVKRGVVLGRGRVDVLLKDKKVSSKHAQIDLRDDGNYYLVDLGSANGIRSRGAKVSELRLSQGSQFVLGSTEIRIIEAEDDRIPEYDTWNVLLARLARRALNAADRQEPTPIQFFDRPLRLRFTRGVQTGEEWVLAYGPRTVGGDTLDCQLDDPMAPDFAFKLLPVTGGVKLERIDSDLRVNGENKASCLLVTGDRITVGQDELEVQYDLP